MSDDQRSQAALTALQHQLPKGITVDVDTFFPRLTGWGVERRNRKRIDLLTKVAPVLERALQADETVQFITRGHVNLWWELLCLGVWAGMINGTTLVSTDQRLLLIHTHRDLPKSYVNHVSRDALKRVTNGRGYLLLRLGSGTINLGGVPRADKKVLTQRLPTNPEAKGGKEHLCPKCYTVHASHRTECRQCHATFKSPAAAARRSALLPGLGDFYLGHHGLAILEMFGALMVWFVVLVLVVDAFEDGNPVLNLGIAAAMLVLAHGIDALLTHAQGKKGLMAFDGALATGVETKTPMQQPAIPVAITPR